MLSPKMQDALNDQINAEQFSAYLYLSMSAYFESEDLPGFANWMRVQVQEETFHAMKFYGYVHERDGRVLLGAIEAPQTTWENPMAAFVEALAHERLISDRINKLVDLALAESDHATNNFLQWFVSEQVEEEASAREIIQKLKRIEGAPGALYMLDRELAARVFTPPVAGE